MIIRKNVPNGLKGQKHPAQGNALGKLGRTSFRALKGQKHRFRVLLPLQGESYLCCLYPGRCPGLCALCPFGARY